MELNFTTKHLNLSCEENNIKIYSTYNEGKAVVIERFNRTYKNWMWKEFTKQVSQNWLHLIKPLLEKYNNKVHSSLGISPQSASKTPEQLEALEEFEK